MFLHFNMATFQDREWGDPTSPPDLFHPTALDTDQWAAAAQSANMTWGCLTTRHHDGFCLWPTKTEAASVGQTSHSIDVVRAYVNSFRKAGLRVGLYYSILSLRDDIRHFNITPAKVKLIKDQLTELLTGYGEIDILITDGWDAPWSRITYEEVPFREIYEQRTYSRTAFFATSTPVNILRAVGHSNAQGFGFTGAGVHAINVVRVLRLHLGSVAVKPKRTCRLAKVCPRPYTTNQD